MLATDLASAWLGIEAVAVSDGHATIRMTLRPEMMNGFGVTHGGMIFAFADSAFAMACNPVDGSGDTMTVAAGADVNFVRPSRAGQVLTAVADKRAGMGRSGLYDVQVFADDGGRPALIAEFRGRSRTVPALPRTDS
jgi:acyl-CoA thioesterase